MPHYSVKNPKAASLACISLLLIAGVSAGCGSGPDAASNGPGAASTSIAVGTIRISTRKDLRPGRDDSRPYVPFAVNRADGSLIAHGETDQHGNASVANVPPGSSITVLADIAIDGATANSTTAFQTTFGVEPGPNPYVFFAPSRRTQDRLGAIQLDVTAIAPGATSTRFSIGTQCEASGSGRIDIYPDCLDDDGNATLMGSAWNGQTIVATTVIANVPWVRGATYSQPVGSWNALSFKRIDATFERAPGDMDPAISLFPQWVDLSVQRNGQSYPIDRTATGANGGRMRTGDSWTFAADLASPSIGRRYMISFLSGFSIGEENVIGGFVTQTESPLLNSAWGFDLRDYLPSNMLIESARFDTDTDPSRPIASWRPMDANPGFDAMHLLTSWQSGSSQILWFVTAPPKSGRIQMPELPVSMSSQLPSGPAPAYGEVLFVAAGASWQENYQSYAHSESAVNAVLAPNTTVNHVGHAATLKLAMKYGMSSISDAPGARTSARTPMRAITPVDRR